MGLFEDTIKEGLGRAEFRAAWDETQAELADYNARIKIAELTHPEAMAVSVEAVTSAVEVRTLVAVCECGHNYAVPYGHPYDYEASQALVLLHPVPA